MPSGVPDILTDEARGLYSLVGSMVTSGIGADRAYKILRDDGAGLTRATVRNIARQIRTSLEYRQELGRVNQHNPIPERLAWTNDALKTDNFIHVVSMLMVDQATGYTVQQFYRYVSPQLMSPAELMQLAENAIGKDGSSHGSWLGFDVIAASLYDVMTGTGG